MTLSLQDWWTARKGAAVQEKTAGHRRRLAGRRDGGTGGVRRLARDNSPQDLCIHIRGGLSFIIVCASRDLIGIKVIR
jgi:hypothetical protein